MFFFIFFFFFFGVVVVACRLLRLLSFSFFDALNRAQRFNVVGNAVARVSQLVEQCFQLDGFFRIGWSDGDWSVVLAVVTTIMARVVVRLRLISRWWSIGERKLCVLNDDCVGSNGANGEEVYNELWIKCFRRVPTKNAKI